jgi:hypothetical protein
LHPESTCKRNCTEEEIQLVDCSLDTTINRTNDKLDQQKEQVVMGEIREAQRKDPSSDNEEENRLVEACHDWWSRTTEPVVSQLKETSYQDSSDTNDSVPEEMQLVDDTCDTMINQKNDKLDKQEEQLMVEIGETKKNRSIE